MISFVIVCVDDGYFGSFWTEKRISTWSNVLWKIAEIFPNNIGRDDLREIFRIAWLKPWECYVFHEEGGRTWVSGYAWGHLLEKNHWEDKEGEGPFKLSKMVKAMDRWTLKMVYLSVLCLSYTAWWNYVSWRPKHWSRYFSWRSVIEKSKWRGKGNSLKEFRMLALGGASYIVVLQQLKYNILYRVSTLVWNLVVHRYLLEDQILNIIH